MRLYEHEGKALLAQHGLAVPRGALWPAVPDGPGPFVVKAQTLAGGRGRRGLIRMAPDRGACGREAEELLRPSAGGEHVASVYVEEHLDVGRELYLAVLADRGHRAPLVVAAAEGGVDVEDLAEAAVVRRPLDPFLGLRPFTARYLASRLGCGGDVAARFAEAAAAVYRAFTASDAELLEVNPLVVTRDGRLFAADVKAVLDDNAAFRHPERPAPRHAGTRFEQRCAALGVSAVEMDGTIAVVVSGAGLMMATVDLLAAAGGRLRAAVDLGGTVFGDPRRLVEVVRAVLGLGPGVVLVNGFFQLASCEALARGVVDALGGGPPGGAAASPPPVVLRLRGRGVSAARDLLEPLGLAIIEDLGEACRAAVARIAGPG